MSYETVATRLKQEKNSVQLKFILLLFERISTIL